MPSRFGLSLAASRRITIMLNGVLPASCSCRYTADDSVSAVKPGRTCSSRPKMSSNRGAPARSFALTKRLRKPVRGVAVGR